MQKSLILLLSLSMWGCRSTEKATLDFGFEENSTLLDQDNDGFLATEDCDDENALINPSAIELCDALDNDCDGSIDEEVQTIYYRDNDGDGFGNVAQTTTACEAPEGYIPVANDCNDDDAAISPASDEVCDSIDNDCDGDIDEDVAVGIWYADLDGDGFGDEATAVNGCAPDESYVQVAGDCDDRSADISPAAIEVCDELDNDCDGSVDEDVQQAYFLDADNDGFGHFDDMLMACEAPFSYVENGDDCDDLASDVFPQAVEICDQQDNNCDGIIDEDTATDAATFFVDNDGDGFGNPLVSVQSCSVPTGYVAIADDCNDGNGLVYPGAVEDCNGVDDDCDGDTDEAGTINGSMWYVDVDGDGYGDPSGSQESCLQPAGYVSNADDCDDGDVAVQPAATEICDTIDNDCNGWTDSDDPNVVGESVFYYDFDGDGFGSLTLSQEACSQPTGYVSTSDDCDDSNAAVAPGAVELCNSIDDNCDGVVDEDSAADASPWYEDADSDLYGNAAVSVVSCEQPSGYVANDDDCDDLSAAISPATQESYDGIDNDCDGQIDNDLWLGDGSDGNLIVNGSFNLSTDASNGRLEADAAGCVVTSISSDTVTCSAAVAGISAGDEVLLINVQGSPTANQSVGQFEFGWVDAVQNDQIILSEVIQKTYGNVSNNSLGGQQIVVQRVPQYANVAIAAGGQLYSDGFDGSTGGLVVFRVAGDLIVDAGGTITANGLGYRGGETGTVSDCDAYQGESYTGLGAGDGDGFCSAYNEATGQWAPNAGGGGAHITGAGGNYAGGATDGDSWNYGGATPPQAGLIYGYSNLERWFFGSGGGGVWRGSPGNPGPGGNGAGIIYIGAESIETNASAAITASGDSTNHWAIGSWTYGAGGGAGGSVWLFAAHLQLANQSVQAVGGSGQTAYLRHGGVGGEGRIRLDYGQINGLDYSQGAVAEGDACVPVPGFSQEIP